MTHQQTIDAYVAAFNAGRVDELRPLFAPDALIHGALGWGGFEQVAPIWAQLHRSLAMTLAVEQVLEQGDEVVVRFVERGCFVGEFRGQAPTGQRSEVMAIEWFQMEAGLIKRRWGVRDSASHFRQMGVTT